MENVHVVWLPTEHAKTSPIQSPASAPVLYLTPSPSAVGIYLGRLSVAAAVASATTATANDPAASPTRGGGGGAVGDDGGAGGGSGGSEGGGGGGGGSAASSPKAARPTSGVPAVAEAAVAGVKKDIELDALVAYTKESTADWLEDVPADFEDEDGGGGSYAGDVKRLRPVPPFLFPATGVPPAAGPDAAAAAAAAAATGSSDASPAGPNGGSGRDTDGAAKHGGDTAPVFIVRPVRVRGTLLIRERGAATAQAAPTVAAAGGVDPDVGEAAAAAARGGAGATAARATATTTAEDRAVELPPLVEVSLHVEAIALQVDVRQYAVLNAAVSALAMSHRRFKFRTVRPTTSVLDDPEAWWRYAIR